MGYKLVNQSGSPSQLAGFVGELTDPQQVLLPIYEFGDAFSFDFEFYEIDPTSTLDVLCTLDLVSYSSVSGFSAVKSGANTITISGRAETAFNSFYKFLTLQDTIEILPSTTKNYKTLVEWSPPPESIIEITHRITVEINADILGYVENTQTFNISQDVHWKWQPALEKFQELMRGGSV